MARVNSYTVLAKGIPILDKAFSRRVEQSGGDAPPETGNNAWHMMAMGIKRKATLRRNSPRHILAPGPTGNRRC
eukprot:660437-Amphidinium_carterae.1